MPKKQDPVISVLRYFETVDLPLAEQALTLVREVVKKRRPVAQAAGKKKGGGARRKKEEDVPLPGMQAQVGG